jgi:hypothetical protein
VKLLETFAALALFIVIVVVLLALIASCNPPVYPIE